MRRYVKAFPAVLVFTTGKFAFAREVAVILRRGGENNQERKTTMGEFTKEGAATALITLDEMFKAIPKSKQGGYLGHLNELCLFIEAASLAAPTEAEAKAQEEDEDEETIDEAEARGN